MKRYLAFYGDFYYPNGGAGDLLSDFDTLQDAVEAIKAKALGADKWGEVLDTDTGTVHNVEINEG